MKEEILKENDVVDNLIDEIKEITSIAKMNYIDGDYKELCINMLELESKTNALTMFIKKTMSDEPYCTYCKKYLSDKKEGTNIPKCNCSKNIVNSCDVMCNNCVDFEKEESLEILAARGLSINEIFFLS